MAAQSFATLPIGVKLAVTLAFYNSFVLIEELVIDRHGLAKYLPLYRVGNVCTYDGLTLAIILFMVFVFPHRRNGQFRGLVRCLSRRLTFSPERGAAARSCLVCHKAEAPL